MYRPLVALELKNMGLSRNNHSEKGEVLFKQKKRRIPSKLQTKIKNKTLYRVIAKETIKLVA
jgi:hypothetical protein